MIFFQFLRKIEVFSSNICNAIIKDIYSVLQILQKKKEKREYSLSSFTAIFFSSPVWLPHYGVPPPSFRRQIRFAAAVRSNSRLNFDGVSAWQAGNIVTLRPAYVPFTNSQQLYSPFIWSTNPFHMLSRHYFISPDYQFISIITTCITQCIYISTSFKALLRKQLDIHLKRNPILILPRI